MKARFMSLFLIYILFNLFNVGLHLTLQHLLCVMIFRKEMVMGDGVCIFFFCMMVSEGGRAT